MGYSTKIMVRRRRVLVLGQFGVLGKLGVFEVPNATVHLLVSLSVLSSFLSCLRCVFVCLVFVRGPPIGGRSSAEGGPKVSAY
jgi:hypothetical protein